VTARLIVKVVQLVNRQRGIDSTAMPLRLISNPYEQSQLIMMGEHFRDRRLLNPRMAFDGSAEFDSVQRKLLKALPCEQKPENSRRSHATIHQKELQTI
jgi:hypothetical protein